MAGLLESLAQGLRGAGGIISDDVYRGQQQEERLAQQLQQQQKMLMVQQLIKAGETGAAPPEAVAQQIKQLTGMEIPVGPDAATQERQRTTRIGEAYSAALERLGPEAPLEAQAQLAARFGKPEVAASLYNAVENRKLREAQIASEIQRAREKLAQDLQLAQQRGEDQQKLAQMRIDAQAQLQQMMIQGRRELAQIAGSMRQQPQPQIVQTESGPMQVDRSGRAVPIVDTRTGQPVTGKSTEKALPTSAAGKLMENAQNLRRAEQVLGLIEGKEVKDDKGNVVAVGDPAATGFKAFLPDAILQRTDPRGIDTRAAIGDLGSLVIHDRSGAAVTAAEFPRLRPFIPLVTDDPATVKKKAKRFVTEYQREVKEQQDFYRESGYRVPNVLQGSGVASPGNSNIRSQADAILNGNR